MRAHEHTHTYTHNRTHTLTPTHSHTHTHTLKSTRTHTHTHPPTYIPAPTPTHSPPPPHPPTHLHPRTHTHTLTPTPTPAFLSRNSENLKFMHPQYGNSKIVFHSGHFLFLPQPAGRPIWCWVSRLWGSIRIYIKVCSKLQVGQTIHSNWVVHHLGI